MDVVEGKPTAKLHTSIDGKYKQISVNKGIRKDSSMNKNKS